MTVSWCAIDGCSHCAENERNGEKKPESMKAPDVSPCLQGHVYAEQWAEYDARGIYLARVCDACVEYVLAGYRPEVLSDSEYEADEPIELDDDYFNVGDL